jgi:hypothetical protein
MIGDAVLLTQGGISRDKSIPLGAPFCPKRDNKRIRERHIGIPFSESFGRRGGNQFGQDLQVHQMVDHQIVLRVESMRV